MADTGTYDWQSLDYGLSNNSVSKTIDLPEVTIKANKNKSFSLLSSIKSFFTSSTKKTKKAKVDVPIQKIDTPTPVLISAGNGFSWGDFSNVLNTVGGITGSVFNFLGQSEQTKQSRIQLEAMSKQKELALAQGEIEYQIQKLDADIELKKQELVAAQKADTTKNIIKVAVIFGILSLLGFITYLLFKRSDSRRRPAQAAIQPPIPFT